MRARVALALAAAAPVLAFFAPAAAASGPPILSASWSSAVASSSAVLSGRIDPDGLVSKYHFDYITEAAYEANGATFAGAARVPSLTDAPISAGAPITVSQSLFGLAAGTTYRYRAVASNSDPASPTIGPTETFTTESTGGGSLLPDSRGWEMVSPVEKNGGQVDPPGSIAGGGVLQAAAGGGEVTYGSSSSFAGGTGAPPASQYLASRSSGGWSTQNVTAPIFSGSYGLTDQGVPYQLFSPDLSHALLLNGEHCRGDQPSGCAVANPPLAGTEAPAGYQNYYLRDTVTSSFDALLGVSDVGSLDLEPADFDLRLAAASPDLAHVVISTCAKLTEDASDGCPADQNLYEWSAGAGLSPSAINEGTPGATIAASAGAVSLDGSRVYWTDGSNLYLHDGSGNHLVDSGASFQTATPDGALSFYTKAGELHSYDALAHTSSAPLASGVQGVLGGSADGSDVYFQDGAGLQHLHDGVITEVAANQAGPAADPGDYPPATGTSRVSADGTKLLFVSTASLTGYDNLDANTKDSDSQVFLYDADGPALRCLSCNPTNGRPIGPSTIPGAIANGTAPGSTDSYKPRVLSADGKRVFFESADALVSGDTNVLDSKGTGAPDVYQWEARAEGDCAAAGGCTALISSGRSSAGARFIDASADGSDAFFLTDASLVMKYDSDAVLVDGDPGGVDVYDARVGGGFPISQPPIPCEGDACQVLPPLPPTPTLTTLLSGHGNPPIAYHRLNCKPGFAKRKGKCVRAHKKKHQAGEHHGHPHHKRGRR